MMGEGEGNLDSIAEKMGKNRETVRVYVFHFKLSTPFFLEIVATFDFDTKTALKKIEMFF